MQPSARRAAQLWLQAFGRRGEAATFPATPRTFKQILDGALRLARDTGSMPEAMRFIGDREAEVAAMRKAISAERRGTVQGTVPPSAVCLISQDPLVMGGYWLPDLLHLAGLTPVGLAAGDEHLRISLEDFAQLKPEVVILAESSPAQAVRSFSARRILRSGSDIDLLSPGPDLYRAVVALGRTIHDSDPPADAELLFESISTHDCSS